MNKDKKIGLMIGLVVVLCVAFYGGMVYGKSQIPARGTQAFGQNGVAGARGVRNVGGGFTTGQIISGDANSITISTQGGGSKIIFVDNNTKVSKQAIGTWGELTVGTEVSITGTPNADGSVTAQSIQIRPNTPPVLK